MKRIIFACTAVLLWLAAPASAHSALVVTDPGPNAVVTPGPRLLKLGYSTPFLFLEDTYQAEVQVTDPDGQIAEARCSTAEIRTLLSVYEFNSPGKYRVSWRAVSDDGHVLGGSHNFSVTSQQSKTTSVAQLCDELGLQEGEVKLPSRQSFGQQEIGFNAWQFLTFCLLAVAIGVGVIRLSRTSRTSEKSKK